MDNVAFWQIAERGREAVERYGPERLVVAVAIGAAVQLACVLLVRLVGALVDLLMRLLVSLIGTVAALCLLGYGASSSAATIDAAARWVVSVVEKTW